jgi:hypothetical protein
VWTESPWTPPTESIERRGHRVWPWIAGVLAFVILCGFGIASCVNFVNSLSHSFGTLGAPIVKPIPIPAAACPYLLVLHVAADSAGVGWVKALDYNTTRQWRPFAVQLAPKLAVLETALLVASVHVPRPVASDFTDALHQVAIGRPPLAASPDVGTYLAQTNNAVINGWSDLNSASALIGNACGFVFMSLPVV